MHSDKDYYSVELHKKGKTNTNGDFIKVIDTFDTEDKAYACMYENEPLIQNDEIIGVYFIEANCSKGDYKMNNSLDFETAIKILKSDVFDDDCSYMGAVLFVAEAFNISVDNLLEKLK